MDYLIRKCIYMWMHCIACKYLFVLEETEKSVDQIKNNFSIHLARGCHKNTKQSHMQIRYKKHNK